MKKTELSRTSTKRAKLIKEGLKTNGTFTIDVASIRARQGAMSSKVADAVFGKERTTEERLAEAVGLLDELLISAGAAYSNKADYNITRYYRCAKEVSTFLKSIKP